MRYLNPKNKKLISLVILITILLTVSTKLALAEDGYISPEIYAVNEADLLDYRDIPPSIKPSIDDLDKPNKIQRQKKQHVRKVKKNQKPYEERMIYKMAKWWTSKTYKLQDPSHGVKHEIKVDKRIEYEKNLQEKSEENK